MQPLRKDHVDYYKDLTNRKFNKQQDVVESEINKDAQVIVDKKGNTFAKELGLENKIKEMTKKVKKLKDFQNSKGSIEDQMIYDVNNLGDDIKDQFCRLSKVRKWNNTELEDLNINKENDPISVIIKAIKDACYEEAEKFIRSKHKLYHALENKRERCLTILHTGSHIQPTLTELSKEMSSANIKLDIPTSLLALPSK